MATEKLTEEELKKLASYKDMAFRSFGFLYLHPQIGPQKLYNWILGWSVMWEEKRKKGEEKDGLRKPEEM